MNFQGLLKIETADFYIDVAIKRSKTKSDEVRSNFAPKMTRLQKSKAVEIEKINVMSITIINFFEKIIKSYPNFDELPEFYKKLIDLSLDMELLKKSLGAIQWATQRINILKNDYIKKIKSSKDLELINRVRREFLGRLASVPKQIKNELKYLENSRRTIKNFPSVKTDLKTIAIAGFPNVGKSTLLNKLTSSTSKINNYAFTTKSLMIGYLKKGYHKIQLIDTPGTLNRVEKMNNVEVQAYLAMRYVADEIICVIDLTENYELKDQLKLYNNILKLHKKVFVYLSKTDIIDKEIVDEFKKSNNKMVFLSLDDLKDMKGLI